MDGGEGMQLSCTPHFKGSKKQTRQFASKLLYFGRQYGAFKNFCPQVGRMPNYISMVQNEFQIIFQEKNKVSTIKIQTEMHFEKHIVQPKQVRLGSETHQLTIIVSASHFALSLNFPCTLKLLAQVTLMFSVKYVCSQNFSQNYFLISKTGEQKR